jgi:hypothetical protein
MTYDLIYWLFAILLVCLRVAIIEDERAHKKRIKNTDGKAPPDG